MNERKNFYYQFVNTNYQENDKVIFKSNSTFSLKDILLTSYFKFYPL